MTPRADMQTCYVVHLARKQNGVGPFRRYLDSYRRFDSGAPHRHLIVFKGFGPNSDMTEYHHALAELTYDRCFVEDTGYDIGAYLRAAGQHPAHYYFFINSFSRFQCDGWLDKLLAAAATGVGLVGATGSWGSIGSYMQFLAGRPGAYAGYLFRHPVIAPPPVPPVGRGRALARMVRRRAAAGARWLGLRPQLPPPYNPLDDYAPFPSGHVRTNAFLVRGDLLASYPPVAIADKNDAHRFESGRTSLTSHALARGELVQLVGRDGKAYPMDRWHESDTFWQRGQENLLVADNQTDNYANGDADAKRFYSRFAWREFADPTPRPVG